MPRTTFDALPAGARLWIFAADRELTAAEADQLLPEVDRFMEDWTAHRAHLTAARDWRLGRFLFIGVDESAAGASGCSIDAMVRDIKRLEHQLQVTFTDHAPVLYRDGEAVARVSRDRFAELARAGAVGPETRVFNNTVATVGELRAGLWEVPAAESWHGRAFF